MALAACQKPAEQTPTEAEPSIAAVDAGSDATATEPAAEGAEAAPTAPTGSPPDGSASPPRDGEGRRGPRGPQTLADMQARMERNFDRRDANGDGVITADELNSDEGGRGGRMLERADANGDGRITRAEVRAEAAGMFRRLDANGDGVVSEDERPQWGGPGGRGPGGPPPGN